MQTPQHILRDQTILIRSASSTLGYRKLTIFSSGGAGLVASALIQRLFGPDFQKDLHYRPLKTIDTMCRSSTFITEASDWQSPDRTGWRLRFAELRSMQRTGQHWMKSIVVHAAANTKYTPSSSVTLRTVVSLLTVCLYLL